MKDFPEGKKKKTLQELKQKNKNVWIIFLPLLYIFGPTKKKKIKILQFVCFKRAMKDDKRLQ